MAEQRISLAPPPRPENWREKLNAELELWRPRNRDEKFELSLGDDIGELRVWRRLVGRSGGRQSMVYTVVWGLYLGRPMVSCDAQDATANEAMEKVAERLNSMELSC